MAMAESYPGKSSLTSFIEKLGGKIRNEFNLEGTNGVVMFVKNNVEKWKSIPINLAVIGETGVGKSTFINTIRNLLDDDEGSALVGVVQTTKIPTPYNHPENENLKIWDLPGFGTADFPKSTYMKNIKAEKFDFFLILSSSRFKLDDVWLAEEIKKTNKTFFFVRTMVDRNIKDVNGRRTNKIPETKLLDDISKECRAGLRSGGFDDADIGLFLIDSHTPNRYEFGKLGRELINAAPEKKRDALTLSITTLTSEMIEEKKILLEKRIWYFAVSSGVVGGIPIPGLGVVFDAALLLEEAIRYRNQFGLNEKGLQKVAKWLKKPVEDLKSSLELKSPGISLTVKGMIVFFRNYVGAEAVENAAKYGIPVIGSILASGVSFWSTRNCLQKLLEMMYEDAMKIQQVILETLTTEL